MPGVAQFTIDLKIPAPTNSGQRRGSVLGEVLGMMGGSCLTHLICRASVLRILTTWIANVLGRWAVGGYGIKHVASEMLRVSPTPSPQANPAPTMF
jgi:hypothetical protein